MRKVPFHIEVFDMIGMIRSGGQTFDTINLVANHDDHIKVVPGREKVGTFKTFLIISLFTNKDYLLNKLLIRKQTV